MSKTPSRFLLLFLAITVLAGCGGSSGGGSNGSGSGGGGVDTPTAVTITFFDSTPSVVAAKIGSGSFASQSVSSGKLALSIPSGTTSFAVAYVCGMYEEVLEATTADGTIFTEPCWGPWSPPQMGTLTGNIDVSAIPGANVVNLATSYRTGGNQGGVPTNTDFTFSAPAGSDRVEVLAFNSTPESSTLVGARNFSNQIVPGSLNGGNPAVFTAADQTTLQSITYSNVPTGYSAPTTGVAYMYGAAGGSWIASATTRYPLLPAGAAVSGDFYEFHATAQNTAKPTEMATVVKSTPTPGPMELLFSTPWVYAGPSAAALPRFDFSYNGFIGKPGVYETATASWHNPAVGNLEILVLASANYLKGTNVVIFPDLSAITGFILPPSSGTQVTWTAQIAQSSAGEPQPMPANATITTVENGGTYTVP